MSIEQPGDQRPNRDLFNIREVHGDVNIINDARLLPLSITVNETQPPLRDWQERAEEKTIIAYFDHPTVRLVGICGAGGYGKSALAARVFGQSNEFQTRLWVNFQQPVSFSTFGRWLGRKFGYEPDDQWTDEQLTIEALNCLAQKRCLLVLDNLETLLQPETLWQPYARFLAQWLGMSGNSKLLLTTQHRIMLPTDCWEWLELRGLQPEQGVRLLQQRGIQSRDADEADLTQFVRLVEGHPLLLTLTATVLLKRQKQDQEPADLRTLQTDDFMLFRQIQEQHRHDPEASVGAVLDVGYQQLPTDLQGVLRRVSVYRLAAFDLAMAQAMLPEQALSEPDLRLLARWSFLQETRQASGWQFSFQPLIQRYFWQVLQEVDERRTADQLASRYFASVRQNPLPVSADRTVEEAAVVAYAELFHHLCELEQYTAAFDAVYHKTETTDDLEDFLARRGFNQMRLSLFARLVQEWQPQDGEEYVRYRDSLVALGSALQLDDQRDRAMQLYEWFLPITQEAGDRLGEANTLKAIADVLQFQKRSDEALATYQQALGIFEQIHDRLGEANTLLAIADVLQFQDRRDEALATYQQALGIFEQIHARLGEANTLQSIGVIHEDLDVGLEYCQRALAIYSQIGDKYSQSRNLIYFTPRVLWNLGRRDDIVVCLTQAIALSTDIAYTPFVDAATARLTQLQQPDNPTHRWQFLTRFFRQGWGRFALLGFAACILVLVVRLIILK